MNIYRLMYNPRPAKNIQEKKAFIVGGGIAGLAAAVFLIDDAKMPGQNITIIDKRAHFGGCCDGFSMGKAMSIRASANWSLLWNAFGISAPRFLRWRNPGAQSSMRLTSQIRRTRFTPNAACWWIMVISGRKSMISELRTPPLLKRWSI